ncbi:MAG: 5'/3'-nucleotidase SurE [Termitinemataceae bacterium]|nr:MAG: 5'/3'-nucleotidase SurE [Termitinemataceae bacterium]
MNILSTNDDGWDCEGIKSLCSVLRDAGHRVVVMAPDKNRSGASHSITMANSLVLIKVVENDVWLCSGTPADCVLSVCSGAIDFMPDIVVSGINAGCNLGTDVVFSGTAGAARQGALSGLPSIAFSQDEFCGRGTFFADAAVWVKNNLGDLLKLWTKDFFINVNFPGTNNFSPVYEKTFLSRRKYFDHCKAVQKDDGWMHLEFEGPNIITESIPGSDDNAIKRNKISVSIVRVQPE